MGYFEEPEDAEMLYFLGQMFPKARLYYSDGPTRYVVVINGACVPISLELVADVQWKRIGDAIAYASGEIDRRVQEYLDRYQCEELQYTSQGLQLIWRKNS